MFLTNIVVNGVKYVQESEIAALQQAVKNLEQERRTLDESWRRNVNDWVSNASYWKDKWDAECAKRQEAQERVASLAELANYRLNEVFCLEKQVASLQERNDWQVQTITMLVEEQLRLQDQVASLNKMNAVQYQTLHELFRENDDLKTQLKSCKDQTEQVDALCQENRRLHEHVREFKDIAAAYARKAEALQQTVKQAKDQAVAEWILSHVHQSYMKEMEKFFGRD